MGLLLGRRKPTHTSLFSMATVGLVREKSHHSRLSFHAHRGAISAIAVQPQGYDMPPRVFTAGQDGALRMWDGRTGALYVESASLTKHRISCLAVAGQYAYMGTSGGEVIVATTDGTPRRKFMAHKSCVTCIQVVNKGRVFTGSTDGTAKFSGADGEVIRQFPLNPADTNNEAILSVFAISANLLFTGSDSGVIRIYNLRQELLRELRTSRLQGIPLKLMEVIHASDKVTIICAHATYLTMWYLTLQKDNFGEYEVIVDAVKTLSSRMPGGKITALKAVFANPLRTNRPSVYLGNTGGAVQVIVPTGKFGSVSGPYNSRMVAPKFKQYTFKDVNSSVSFISAGGGRLYAGTVDGGVFMWKECLAMLNLRRWSAGRADTHGYRHRGSVVRSRTVLMEQRDDDEEPQASEADLQAFAKVADSDISDAEAGGFYAEPVLIGLSDSIPDASSGPSRSNRSSTMGSPASAGSDRRTSYHPSMSSTNVNSSPSSNRNLDSARSSSNVSSSPLRSSMSVASAPRDLSSQGEAYIREIIQLLQDSAADLATLPDPSPGGVAPSQDSDRLSGSFSRMSMSSPSPYGGAPAERSSIPLAKTESPSRPPPPSEEEQRCVVCLDSPKDSILYQCGHVCVCNPCGKQLLQRKLKCPMCRAEIKDCIFLYK